MDLQYDRDANTILSIGRPAPKILQWTIKYPGGLVKTEQGAEKIVLAGIAIAIIVSIFLSTTSHRSRPEASSDISVHQQMEKDANNRRY
jgi:hypothetical protein